MEKKLQVDVGHTNYPIIIGWNSLNKLLELIPPERKLLIVTDNNIYDLYFDRTDAFFYEEGKGYNFQWKWKVLPPGEETKTFEKAKELYDEASNFEMDRESYFIAFGGGVIGDLCGFVASTYMRGTNFLQVPTTLLAQVDSSVGGKVAVNHPRQKNLIGSFYHPKAVLMDLSFLKTLPKRDFNSGLAEVVKSAILWDRDFFFFIKDFIESDITSFEEKTAKKKLLEIIAKSCEIKARVVKEDEKDHNLRQILNLGHTFAHALEGATNYSYFQHGEAVMWGIIFASRLSYEKGILSREDTEEIISLIERLAPPKLPNDLKPQELACFFQTDKKRRGDVVPFILPVKIGEVKIFRDVSPEEAISVVDNYC